MSINVRHFVIQDSKIILRSIMYFFTQHGASTMNTIIVSSNNVLDEESCTSAKCMHSVIVCELSPPKTT